jgi:hypothetical protein
VSIRLETPLELSYLAPSLEIIIRVPAVVVGYDVRNTFSKEAKGTSGAYDPNGHIVLVKHQDITV